MSSFTPRPQEGRIPPFRRRLARTSALALMAGTLPWLPTVAYGQQDAADAKAPVVALPAIDVDKDFVPGGMSVPPVDGHLGRQAIADRRTGTPDTAALLSGLPGMALQGAGGISSLPVIRGLGDDRVLTLVNNVPITASCPNHMNPALSYIAPGDVGAIDVLAGVTPVSRGGDNIGGTIAVTTPDPQFAGEGQGLAVHGDASTAFRSVNNGTTVGGHLSAATDRYVVSYAGSWSRGDDYDRGGDGKSVNSTLFETQSHALSLAARVGEDGVLEVRGGVQVTPYEGFANQRMDMTDNRGTSVDAHYKAGFAWGRLDATAYWQHVRHAMNFLADKGGYDDGGMPMNTRSNADGYTVKADIPLSAADTLRVGNEFHHYALDDWWPPVGGMMAMMMGPNTFHTINGGTRDRLGTYVEWERTWGGGWSSLAGLRNDTVWTGTGTVSGYNASYAKDAAAFNARDRSRTDANVDATAELRYAVGDQATVDLGYARKSRSPNLYERYAWSTGNMASSMITWNGDGNFYVGNPDLKPEVANTVSTSLSWHAATAADGEGATPPPAWEVRLTPYYSYIEDYISQRRLGTVVSNGVSFAKVMFANRDARTYGVDLSGRATVWRDADLGVLGVSGSLGWVRGQTVSDDDGLYHMMPLNGRIGVEHTLGGWHGAVDVQMVDAKTKVDHLLNEPTTPGYTLVNLRGSYSWGNIRVDVAIENLMDKAYALPLGGIDYGDWQAGNHTTPLGSLPGPGRSFNAGLTVAF
ncbi:TonB-dependent receptor [Nitrospirillum iridis]|uniref:Iron complex outermembrane receptor protein n=1 Tax=Nitrospirillum iridis TaxID=765888 RepID=A0A7X0B4V7_9PROT|nr:TonB-dependent receptor [Nitrospirillum iridis]MBB6254695.1 iron complex outermembrane receptor protein [Nitrospirillum iridis]